MTKFMASKSSLGAKTDQINKWYRWTKTTKEKHARGQHRQIKRSLMIRNTKSRVRWIFFTEAEERDLFPATPFWLPASCILSKWCMSFFSECKEVRNALGSEYAVEAARIKTDSPRLTFSAWEGRCRECRNEKEKSRLSHRMTWREGEKSCHADLWRREGEREQSMCCHARHSRHATWGEQEGKWRGKAGGRRRN